MSPCNITGGYIINSVDGLHVVLVAAIEALYVVPREGVILMTYLCCTDVET